MHIAGARRHRWRCRERAGDSAPARAGDLQLVEQALATFFDLNRQEVAVLATALAVLGFSVVAAILLMRTRVRAANNEARLRSELQRPAGRSRSLPRAAVRRTAGSDLVGGGRQPSANQRRYLAADAAGCPAVAAAHSRLRNLAVAGAGAADGPRRQRAARGRRRFLAQSHHVHRPLHRGDGPRHRRPGHRADSRTQRACAANSPK